MKKSFSLLIIIFLIVNFGGLFIGGLFAGDGASSDWYQSANKAPWTPYGWVFGAAWTTIMLCFSGYMALLIVKLKSLKWALGLFSFQWLLNVGWNPVFFYYHQALAGLIIITLLTIIIGCFIFLYQRKMNYYSILIYPYFLWLLIATSLNGYILFFN
ncbi:MAG: TspO/MBR family protein [Parvicellaceae bacterium]